MEEKYLDNNDISSYALSSWSKCLERGLPRKIYKKNIHYAKNISSQLNIDIFLDLVSFITTCNKNNLLFLLSNKKLELLAAAGCERLKNKVQKYGIIKGFSFSEESIGVNAISAAAYFKKPVYMKGKYNYNHFLKNYKSFAFPIGSSNYIQGYLCTMMVNKDFTQDVVLITELLAYIIAGGRNLTSTVRLKRKYKISDHQLQVLKMIAEGLTEEVIADRLNLSRNTIKYHKKVILKKLNVQSIIEAVVRALQLGFFSLDEINL